jgi:hypothetical protein
MCQRFLVAIALVSTFALVSCASGDSDSAFDNITDSLNTDLVADDSDENSEGDGADTSTDDDSDSDSDTTDTSDSDSDTTDTSDSESDTSADDDSDSDSDTSADDDSDSDSDTSDSDSDTSADDTDSSDATDDSEDDSDASDSDSGSAVVEVAYSCAEMVGDNVNNGNTYTYAKLGTTHTHQSAVTVSGSSCVVSGNGVPDHDFGIANAPGSDFAENAKEYTVTTSPTQAAASTALSLRIVDGVVLNGLPIDFFPNECYEKDQGDTTSCDGSDYMYNPGTSDTAIANRLGFDNNNAHPQPDGTYHYHGDPKNYAADTLNPVAYAGDGFPIYAYYQDANGDAQRATSGYTLKSGTRTGGGGGAYDGKYMSDHEFTNVGNLDECNGSDQLTADGSYAYYFTDDFPYLPYCLKGTLDDSFNK